jgi:hypothetical protein
MKRLLLASCLTCFTPETGPAVESADHNEGAVTFTKQVEVFGLHVYATSTTSDDKLLHAANVLAEYIDNDENGQPDNPKILQALQEAEGAIVMFKDEREAELSDWRTTPRGQGLYDEETIPNGRAQGRFDASLEEILHLVSDLGWAGAYPEVFGRVPGTQIANAMDRARGGRFFDVPRHYPARAWYSYDDATCDYDCQNSEYIYWALTSILEAQDYPGRLDEIGREWKLNTREKVRTGDPAVYSILTDPEYRLPKVLPDGKYQAEVFVIQPYHPRERQPPQGKPGSAISVWAAGCTEKIQDRNRASLPHDGVWNAQTGTVTLSGVRGEVVPFQLVVSVTDESVSDVTLSIADLRCGEDVLAADNVRPYLEHLVTVYAPTGRHGRKGTWPDPLVPLTRPFRVASAPPDDGPRHQPVWLDIDIPRDQPPGTYRGAITVHSGRGMLGTVDLKLKVWNVVLPETRHFPAHVGLYEHHIARMHALDQDSDEFRELLKSYLRFFLENRLDPRTPPRMHGRFENGRYELDWPNPDLEELFLDYGRIQFQISPVPVGISGPGREEPFTPEYQRSIREHVQQVIEHAKENGWYNRLLFLIPIDEPKTAQQYEAVRRWAAAIREVDPNVRVTVTEQPSPEDPAWGSLVGHVNAWTVNGNYLFHDVEAIRARHRAGDFVTWYISCDQLYPQPNYYIDREAADPRMVAWLTWHYELDGILYWTSTFWEEIRNPWIDPITWKWFPCNSPAAGEGSLVYPGHLAERYSGQENVLGPVGSMRLALLREGLEELELLRLLAESGYKNIADEIAASICRDARDFSRDPNEIDAARDRLIEQLAGIGAHSNR